VRGARERFKSRLNIPLSVHQRSFSFRSGLSRSDNKCIHARRKYGARSSFTLYRRKKGERKKRETDRERERERERESSYLRSLRAYALLIDIYAHNLAVERGTVGFTAA